METPVDTFRRNLHGADLEFKIAFGQIDSIQLMSIFEKNVSDVHFEQMIIAKNGDKTHIKMFKNGKGGSSTFVGRERIGRIKSINRTMYHYQIYTTRLTKIKEFVLSEETTFQILSRAVFVKVLEGLRWKIHIDISDSITGTENKNLKAHTDFLQVPFLELLANLGKLTCKLTVQLDDKNPDALRQEKVNEIVAYISGLLSSSESRKEIEYQKILKIILGNIDNRKRKGILSLKPVLPSVKSLTKHDFQDIYPIDGYYMTIKTDGYRALAAITEDGECYVISDLKSYSFEPQARANEIPKEKADNIYISTIADGELVIDADDNIRFYIFDAIKFEQKDIMPQEFSSRIKYLDKIANRLNDFFPAYAKQYQLLSSNNMESDIRKIHDQSYPFERDGLIIVSPDKSYLKTESFKWKPKEKLTIDALARHIGGQEYILFVSVSRAHAEKMTIRFPAVYNKLFPDAAKLAKVPIPLAPSFSPLAWKYTHPKKSKWGQKLDWKVIEIIDNNFVAGQIPNWEIVKVRNDRDRDVRSKTYFGNALQTAEKMMTNYIDPFPIEVLWEGVDTSNNYFIESKGREHVNMTRTLSLVKADRIKNLKGSVLDIGFGKGQDLMRYINSDVKELVALEPDGGAIIELVHRKYTYLNMHDKKVQPNILVFKGSMNNDFDDDVAQLQNNFNVMPGSIDTVICNIAFHYFVIDNIKMQNAVDFIKTMTHIGSRVSILDLDGQKVFNKLIENNIKYGEEWNVGGTDESGVLYSIRRMFKGKKLADSGQVIEVLLPFSRGTYYSEYLVNFDSVQKMFEGSGSFRFVEKKTPDLTRKLTPSDIEWLSFFCEITFERI